jgi:hypothetical protein
MLVARGKVRVVCYYHSILLMIGVATTYLLKGTMSYDLMNLLQSLIAIVVRLW